MAQGWKPSTCTNQRQELGVFSIGCISSPCQIKSAKHMYLSKRANFNLYKAVLVLPS
jgi:hypothetical protein